MIQKIKHWFARRKTHTDSKGEVMFTRTQVTKIAEDYGQIRYNDGKRDGLAIAREQAQKSLKEILWAQNQSK